MVRAMNKRPIIFAMANPNPEILPDEVKKVRDDAIIATGRSDFPNQVNNVLCFPSIFRGALDVHATEIDTDMKLAATYAISMLAREQVPEEVSEAIGEQTPIFGPEYIIPSPFDNRLIEVVSLAVAKAAIASGVARKPIANEEQCRAELRQRLERVHALALASLSTLIPALEEVWY
jgi:malate dehydrogenase (oxaloacetate-decarboxylating)(NADP+)